MDKDPDAFFERVRFRGDPCAAPDSIVVIGNARFTVLTPRLLRLEWSQTGEFDDRGTFAFPTRSAPVPAFETGKGASQYTIDTGILRLHYRPDGDRLGADNLSIAFWWEDPMPAKVQGMRNPQVWWPGLEDQLNLRGTRRTLDGCEGDASLEPGLISRAGWSVFDDSRSIRFDPRDGWIRPAPVDAYQDWYFLGYGHDYRSALSDYRRFGHAIPLIPRFVLGAWWSRYWAYSAEDLKELVSEFERQNLPLDVLVVDMDWHTPHAWTGYTWNRELFPDPPAFLDWVHKKGLRVTLNLHPAQGVQRFEEIYPRFAQAMGIDPGSNLGIAFRISDRSFVRNYFELLHHPMEDEGVDFWWVDWQQGDTSELVGLDPLPWLNHLHFSDSARRGQRPLLYSRWGGLGSHRYPIGFSGDTYVAWSTLQFLPHFTATASNVAFGCWSHDIGGHMGGATEPELFARWVQFGALSPALRLHGTKDVRTERRPWKYPEAAYQAAKAAFHLRYQLIPYLYTIARVASDTGISLCRPMYYEFPGDESAYVARFQYFLGDQLIAAPIVHAANPTTGMAAADVWVPEGTWFDFFTREAFQGPGWVRIVGDLNRVPLLVRAGGILPLAGPLKPSSTTRMSSGTSDAVGSEHLTLAVFPGARGSFRLYEDDGSTNAYRDGEYEWTRVSTRMRGPELWEVVVEAAEGHCPALPGERSYEVRLEGSCTPAVVTVDGLETRNWSYNPESLTTSIRVSRRDRRTPVAIAAWAPGGITAVGEGHNRRLIREDVRRLLGAALPPLDRDEALAEAVLHLESPGKSDALARLGGPFVHWVEHDCPEEMQRSLGRMIVAAPRYDDEPMDVEARFVRHRSGQRSHARREIVGTRQSVVLDVPFRYDGQVESQYWTAEVQVTWKGATLTYAHQSEPLFSSIYTWQSLVPDEGAARIALEQVVDELGRPRQGLGWKARIQEVSGLSNAHEPHLLDLSGQKESELAQPAAPACYLAVMILSPDEQEAILQFRWPGSAQVFLNGCRVDQEPGEIERVIHPRLRPARATRPMRLRRGDNYLLLHLRPTPSGTRPWLFGAALTTRDGKAISDLSYCLPAS